MKRILVTSLALLTSMLISGSGGSLQNGCIVPAMAQTTLLETGGEGKLHVFAGRSMIIQSRNTLKRVSITDPGIASTVIVSPTQVMIHGLKPGTVTLLLWDGQDRMRSFDLQVEIDTRSFSAQLKEIFPGEEIEVSQSENALVLNGAVSSQAIMDQAVALGGTLAPAVVNTMWIREPPKDTIMLKVRFAEVNRSATQELGVNFLSTGAGNTIGSSTTQQFGNIDYNSGKDSEQSGTFELNDLLNIFIFNPDVNLGMVLRAMQQRSLLQILAEPNLLAADGQEASFLAGGEFPVPVIQSAQTNSVTIDWREFGIRLNFAANVLDDGRIRLKVAPEVSALDYSNAITISGFLVPALSSRKAETELELGNGQSFAIAGLLDNRTRENFDKIPGLGDIPLLGNLFKSKSKNKSNTELMVLVTPSVVKPSEPGQEPPLPEFPEAFLDSRSFDKHHTGALGTSDASNKSN